MIESSDSYKKIVTKAWKDPAFKKKLLSNPEQALKEIGVKIPNGIKVKIIETSANEYIFSLPRAPDHASEMKEEELKKLAAGCEAWAGSCVSPEKTRDASDLMCH